MGGARAGRPPPRSANGKSNIQKQQFICHAAVVQFGASLITATMHSVAAFEKEIFLM